MSANPHRSPVGGTVQVLAAAALFGTTGTAQALGPDASDPLTVGAGRMLVGGLALVLVARWLRTGAARRGVSWPAVAVVVMGTAAYQPLFFAAVKETGVAIGTIVAIGSAPVITGAVEWLLQRERPSRLWLPATCLAIAGCALILLPGEAAEVASGGVVLALGAGLSYAAFTLAGKSLLHRDWAPADVAAVGFGGGAVVLLPLLVLGDNAWLGAADGVALVLYLGLIPTALAYTLFFRGLSILASSRVTTLTLAEPLTAATLGIVVVGESLTLLGVLGAVLVLAALGVLALDSRDEEKAPQVL